MAQSLIKSFTAMALVEKVVLGEEYLKGLVEVAHCSRVVLLLMHQQSHLVTGNTQ